MTIERGKSDRPVVAGKSPNKVAEPTAEAMEPRGLAEGNSPERNMHRTQGRQGMPSALERVRQAAGRDRKQRFTALLHHVYGVCARRTSLSSETPHPVSTARRGGTTASGWRTTSTTSPSG